jgi:ribosomal peptide maturation radical SAM protein 1
MPKIALVSMPFASTRRPSLQLGLLAGLAKRSGWEPIPLHMGVDFAALIGRKAYELLCQHRGIQLGDWLFSKAAFGSADVAPDELVSRLTTEYHSALSYAFVPDDLRQRLTRIRGILAPAFVEATAQAIVSSKPDLVGISSTFQQNVASFALSAAIKRLSEGTPIIFGGANFDDVMGLEFVRSIPSIDFAAIGEADESFPEFLIEFAGARDPGSVLGIASRNADGSVRFAPRTQAFDRLDELPIPDFDDYFERSSRHGFYRKGLDDVDLPVEGSRGCWWGAKQHCVFCGLNANGMSFRAKSPMRLANEIAQLSARYSSLRIEAVDNIIDMSLFKSWSPDGNIDMSGLNIFFEVKSNLKKEQIKTLSRSGVRRIQPGIESFSSDVLRLMRKGVSGIQNVNLLRWCKAYGIRPSWNFLWGFPGEKQEYYRQQEELIPKLKHLQPPDGQGRVWLERFSPLYTQQELFGVTQVKPEWSYGQIYPPNVDLNQAAYFFEYSIKGALPDNEFNLITDLLNEWRNSQGARLDAFLSRNFIRIVDTRASDSPVTYELTGDVAAIYRAAIDDPVGRETLSTRAGVPPRRSAEILEHLCQDGLVVTEGALVLSLAIPSVASN